MEFLNLNIYLYIAAYLLSAIPFGYILAKQFAGVDIKNAGSKNIGATNVLRVVKETNPSLAKKLGITTLLLDGLKGTLVLLFAKYLGVIDSVLWTIAVLSVVGHCYSIFLGFEGGKGVATAAGVLFVLLPIPMLIALIVWFFSAKVLKISSLSSLIALVAMMLSSYIFTPDITHAPLWIITGIIVYKHIPNISRIFNKSEGKLV